MSRDPKRNIVIPDLIIYDTLNSILDFIRGNYKQTEQDGDVTQSLLYQIFNQLRLERYGFFNQAVQLIITEPENPKHIKVSTAYDRNSQQYPSIHISLPSESSQTNQDTLGIGEGDFDPILDDINSPSTYRKVFTRHYHATYHIIIVSDNKNEIILLYHFLKACLIASTDHFELSCLYNLKFGGQDLRFDPSIPPGIFMRAISMDFDYESQFPDFIATQITNNCLINLNIQITNDNV